MTINSRKVSDDREDMACTDDGVRKKSEGKERNGDVDLWDGTWNE
jgi:hypothetical protein